MLAIATAAAGGDPSKAVRWYLPEKLAPFGGKTAAQLVADGRADDLVRYIESMEAGPAG